VPAQASAAAARPDGRPARVALVVGTTTGGTGPHVRMLAVGLAARGIAVSVFGPSAADARFGFGTLSGVTFGPAEFGDRPRPRDLITILRLRSALARANTQGGVSEQRAVAHAHGLRAGALTALALGLVRGGQRPKLVVTVHNAPPSGAGAPTVIYGLLERLVARRADLVLCVSADLEARLRAVGARQVGRAVVPAPPTRPTPVTPSAAPFPEATAAGRPVVLAAGRLVAQKGFGALLEAAVAWRDLATEPLLAIAGDGPLAGELRARAVGLGVDVAFLGHRDDVGGLLAAAAVFVLPSRWEGQPLVLQEALRAGVPIVATRTGGIPDLVGGDAALLVEPGDAAGLAAAVRAVLADPSRAAGLRAAVARRAAALPTEDDAVAAALSSYGGAG
jgi:glycosyltransferase involved in cell wall biosynthesis